MNPSIRHDMIDYRNEIDGLRAIAVSSVIVAHAGFDLFAGGYVGVDIFFVISGYLIFSIISSELEQGKFSFRHFYKRRVRRIFPALFLVIAVSFPVGWVLMVPSQFVDFSLSAASAVLFISNVYFWDAADYFAPDSLFQPLLHTWSLAVEEQYYLLFPPMIVLVWRFAGRNAAYVSLLLAAIASFGLAEWGSVHKPVPNYFFTFSRVWELLAGAICCAIEKRKVPATSNILAGFGILLLLLAFTWFDDLTPFPSRYTLVPVFGTALILLFARGKSLIARTLSFRPLVLLGLISYSAYLWHQPVFAYARIAGLESTAGFASIPLVLMIIVLSTCSWRFVEKPWREYGRRDSGLRPLTQGAICAATMLTLAGAGLLGGFTDVSSNRYARHDQPLVEVTRRSAKKYLYAYPRALTGRPFANNGSIKVLFVGDSYAMDVLNGLNETGVIEFLDVSLHVISSACGNIFLTENSSLTLPPTLPALCDDIDRYESNWIKTQISEADVVILASNWKSWVVPYLPETIENLRSATTATIFLLGSKAFPVADIKLLLKLDPRERKTINLPVESENIHTNEELAKLGIPEFLNIQSKICPAIDNCPIVGQNGQLLSLDTGHLTQEGAVHSMTAILEGFPELREALGVSRPLNSLQEQ